MVALRPPHVQGQGDSVHAVSDDPRAFIHRWQVQRDETGDPRGRIAGHGAAQEGSAQNGVLGPHRRRRAGGQAARGGAHLPQHFLDAAFELRVAPGDHRLRVALDTQADFPNALGETTQVFTCLMAGLIGIGLGAGAAFVLHRTLHWSTSVGASSVLIATLLAAAVGMLFGVWPARRAARLDPIEPLRHE